MCIEREKVNFKSREVNCQMGMRAIVILSAQGKNRCPRAMVLDEGPTKWLLSELHIR